MEKYTMYILCMHTLHTTFASWMKAYDTGRLSKKRAGFMKKDHFLLLIFPSLIFFFVSVEYTHNLAVQTYFINFGVKYLHINCHFLYFVSVAEGMKGEHRLGQT